MEIPKNRRMSFSVFRQILSKQMLEYDPLKSKYIRDEMSRSVTQAHKKRKLTRCNNGGERQQRAREDESYYNEGGMAVGNFVRVLQLPRLAHGGDLNKLQVHLKGITKKTNKMICEVCGEVTYWTCGICKKWICTTDGARKWNGAECAISFHNPTFWGSARSDVHLHNTKQSDWTPPMKQMIKRNEDRVTKLKWELKTLGNKK